MQMQLSCESAGIIGYHAGEAPDSRMRRYAARRGYDLLSRARQFRPATDFATFDYIIGMDDDNIADLTRMANTPQDKAKIHKMTEFAHNRSYTAVPDPYYGGEAEFEQALDILEDACNGLLQHLTDEL